MLRSIEEVRGYKLEASDGDVGKCKDFLFDDQHWTIRYLVADTGGWLSGRKVLISPISLNRPDWDSRRLHTRLGKSRIESAPPLDADAPVSRQYEIDYHAHFGWPVYWQDTGVWAAGAFPQPLFSDHARVALKEPEMIEATGDPNLRSVAEVKGYEIKARDGMIGHVDDFILDDENWTVRYLVVDTRKWLIGKRVLVSPLWVADVRWDQREVEVDLTRAQVKDSPEFKPDEPVNRTYEARLYDYYGRPHYW
jgi:hypothetical protein